VVFVNDDEYLIRVTMKTCIEGQKETENSPLYQLFLDGLLKNEKEEDSDALKAVEN
jgi:hypothetical protein